MMTNLNELPPYVLTLCNKCNSIVILWAMLIQSMPHVVSIPTIALSTFTIMVLPLHTCILAGYHTIYRQNSTLVTIAKNTLAIGHSRQLQACCSRVPIIARALVEKKFSSKTIKANKKLQYCSYLPIASKSLEVN